MAVFFARYPGGKGRTMTSRMIGDFRVRCAIVQESSHGYIVQICTRRMGANTPEKCWEVPGQDAHSTQTAAEQFGMDVFERINNIRYNGEPEFAHASA
jgi:hypothetical protein